MIPIPSSKTRAHLDDNLTALDVEFLAEDLWRIDDICPVGAAAGTRYPESPDVAGERVSTGLHQSFHAV